MPTFLSVRLHELEPDARLPSKFSLSGDVPDACLCFRFPIAKNIECVSSLDFSSARQHHARSDILSSSSQDRRDAPTNAQPSSERDANSHARVQVADINSHPSAEKRRK